MADGATIQESSRVAIETWSHRPFGHRRDRGALDRTRLRSGGDELSPPFAGLRVPVPLAQVERGWECPRSSFRICPWRNRTSLPLSPRARYRPDAADQPGYECGAARGAGQCLGGLHLRGDDDRHDPGATSVPDEVTAYLDRVRTASGAPDARGVRGALRRAGTRTCSSLRRGDRGQRPGRNHDIW